MIFMILPISLEQLLISPHRPCLLLHFFFAHTHLHADTAGRFTGLPRTVRVLIHLVGDFINGGGEFLHRTGLLRRLLRSAWAPLGT